MKSFKNKKVLITFIVIVLLIAIVGVVLAFSLKKSNKEEFFKYFSQLFDEKNSFVDEKLKQYSAKKEQSSYDNQGKITVTSSVNNMESETTQKVNDGFYISFAGNIDNPSNIAEELIRINYSKNASFPIYYKQVDNIKAVKLGKIVQKYLAIDSNELDTFFSKFGLNLGIENKDFSAIMELLKSKYESNYLEILKNELDEEYFTKITKDDMQGYSLQITNERFKNIVVKILENAIEDQDILDSFGISADVIESLIQNLENTDIEAGKTTIDLYQKNGILNRIIIQYNDELKVDITKNESENYLAYNIGITSNLTAQDMEIKIKMEYTGLDNLEKVESNFNIELNIGENNYSYNIENEENFIPVTVQEFKEDEYTKLNKYSSAKLTKLFTLLGEKFVQKNNELIEQTGIKAQDYLASILPMFAPEKQEIDEDKFYENDNEENKEETNSENAEKTNNTENKSNSNSEAATSFSETEKNIFNKKYEEYKGDEITGSKVKQLIMNIIANNMADEERQIKLTGDFTLTGDEVPEGIETSKKYIVQLGYSNDGYVNKVEITAAE